MKRRELIIGLGSAAAWPLTARAQQPERMRRIGVLMALDPDDPEDQSEMSGLKQGLQELGWVEGRNLQIEYFWPGGEPSRIQTSAKELAGRQCEVIVARSTPVVAGLLCTTRTRPRPGTDIALNGLM
jgi:putative tryptophan/tyrosine transport system substrate-binding protein